ncbi:MAG: tRNA dihydrouridine synthase DusB [Halieaceae bacterium]|jgi:tRNA-dihydrouridine synthase B|nr:tRNA dihydrouridine synthase DusB [Halieaceae bacterium]
MQIGPYRLRNNVALAPMAGVTDLPLRELAIEYGAGLAVGEMLTSDLSLTASKKSSLRRRRSDREGLRSVQIVGSEPDTMAEAARFNVDEGAQIIDINMGCPAKKVCRKAAGSALLADEQLVADILEAVVSAVSVPVTLKIRTGVSREARNGVRIARIAEQSGIQLLTIHGRTRADRFNGEAEYDTIAHIVDAVSIPVLANGDIDCADKARAVLRHTGADGVMIGRAAQGRPWLPGLIAAQLAGDEDARAPSIRDQLQLMQSHVLRLHDFYGVESGLRIARKHVGWTIERLWTAADAKARKAAFNSITDPELQLSWLEERFEDRFEQLTEQAHSVGQAA